MNTVLPERYFQLHTVEQKKSFIISECCNHSKIVRPKRVSLYENAGCGYGCTCVIKFTYIQFVR